MRRAAGLALLCIAVLGVSVSVAVALPANVPVSAFVAADGCGCHATFVQEWSQSMHAQALSDPVFRYKVEEGDKATNGAVGLFCKKCHGPIADMTGGLKSGKLSPAAAQGVQCTFCHQVTGTTVPVQNVSQTLVLDGTRRAQLKDPQAPHTATYSAFHESAEFCGACHNVSHPANGAHLEATYSEWLAGPYAKEGVTCQHCHMSQSPGFVGPSAGQACATGKQRENIFHMTFVGANVAQGNRVNSTKLLQSAATVDLGAPQVLAPGTSADVSVTVTNVGAGHMLPTGLTEVRQMWLEVVAVTPGGETKIGERTFGTVLKDAKGKYPVEVWDAVGVQSDDRIAPKASIRQSFRVSMPASDETMTLKASLYYRSMPDELAKAAGVTNPVTTIASSESQVFGSADAMSESLRPQGKGGIGQLAVYALFGVLAVMGAVMWFVISSRRAR